MKIEQLVGQDLTAMGFNLVEAFAVFETEAGDLGYDTGVKAYLFNEEAAKAFRMKLACPGFYSVRKVLVLTDGKSAFGVTPLFPDTANQITSE